MTSVVTSEGTKQQSAKSTFIKILKGERVANDESHARQKTIRLMTTLASLVNHLLDNTHKIEDAEIAITSVDDVSLLDSKKRKASLLDNSTTRFESKAVKFLLHVPYQWLWDFVNMVSKKKVDAKTKSKLSEKGPVQIRKIIYYMTGLYAHFKLPAALLEKATLTLFLKHLAESRGNLIDAHGGVLIDLFTGAAVIDWCTQEKHGVFYFTCSETCPPGMADELVCRALNNKKIKLDNVVPGSTVIYNNYSEWEAHMCLGKRKDYLKDFFPKELVKLTDATAKPVITQLVQKQSIASAASTVAISEDTVRQTRRRIVRPQTGPSEA